MEYVYFILVPFVAGVRVTSISTSHAKPEDGQGQSGEWDIS